MLIFTAFSPSLLIYTVLLEKKKGKLKSQIRFFLISEWLEDNCTLQLKNVISLIVFIYTF